MGEFVDSPSKKVIRLDWCKGLISYLHEFLKYRFLYLGLPGIALYDVEAWSEYIDHIIAFQCRDYPNPSSISQSAKKVAEMEESLKAFERKGIIKTFSLYDGYIEEVVLRGRDTVGNIFSQNDVVTIYNLDFCNNLTTALSVSDDKGTAQNVYKSHAIKKLLEIQRDITSNTRPKKFIMFLTVHAAYQEKEIHIFQKQPESKYLLDYFKRIKRLQREEKQIRLLKAYILDIIRRYFAHCNFSCHLLPAIYYKGAGVHSLVTFTIVGAKDNNSVRTYHKQPPYEFLRTPFLTVKKEKLDLYSNPSVEDLPIQSLDPVAMIKGSEHFIKLWS
jgi:hypothetical protein